MSDEMAAGHAEAAYNLGNQLADQSGREAEAEAAYRTAMAAGHAGAANNLGNLLAGQPGREGEAEAAYRVGMAAGDAVAFLQPRQPAGRAAGAGGRRRGGLPCRDGSR